MKRALTCKIRAYHGQSHGQAPGRRRATHALEHADPHVRVNERSFAIRPDPLLRRVNAPTTMLAYTVTHAARY